MYERVRQARLENQRPTRAIAVSVIIIVVARLLPTISADVARDIKERSRGRQPARQSPAAPRTIPRRCIDDLQVRPATACRESKRLAEKSVEQSSSSDDLGAQRGRRGRLPLISRPGQNVPGSPGTRLPDGNNDGLSAPATVRHCSLLRHDRSRIEAGRDGRGGGRGDKPRAWGGALALATHLADAPPCASITVWARCRLRDRRLKAKRKVKRNSATTSGKG